MYNTGVHVLTPDATAGYRQQTASNLFEHAYRRGWWWRLICRLTGRRPYLIALKSICTPSAASHYGGIQAVELNRIIGSESREDDFDSAFYPINKHTRIRWISIASAREDAIPLPPVALIQVGDDYFVRDGHHRISVAHARGEQVIEAEVNIYPHASYLN